MLASAWQYCTNTAALRTRVWLCARNARVARDDEARWALLAAPLDASPTLDPKTRRQRFPRHHLLASARQPALDLDLTLDLTRLSTS